MNASVTAPSARPRRGEETTPPGAPRAGTALVLGVLFSAAFTGLIWLLGDRLEGISLLPDTGAAWYYWRLPQPTFWTRASAWGLYLAHQIAMWALLARVQSRRPRYSDRLHRFNLAALAINALFILLHLLQSHIWYDGLAQDVSVFSSQGSVIVLLVWVLLMENSRRGLVWGRKIPLSRQVIDAARRYHGYFFLWATIYTFWFHPMVATSGHLVGFFYMFLLLLQGSLFYTRIHRNRWWTFGLEFMVLIHGTLVAVMQGNGIWPMFFFGFAGIFIITQMHGLGLSLGNRLILLGLYAGAVLWVYSERGWNQLNEIIRIPLIDYVAVLVLAGLIWLGCEIARRLGTVRRRSPT